MEKKQRPRKNILELTLARLQKLYDESEVCPGRLVRLGIKPWWNTVLGSNDECGVAANFTGIHAGRTENQKFLDLIGKSLFEIANWGIHSGDLMERSVGIAALMCTLPATYRKFIGTGPGIPCPGLDKRG